MHKSLLMVVSALQFSGVLCAMAGPATTQPAQAEHSALSGVWKGKAKGLDASIDFHSKDACGNEATWHVLNNKALMNADLKCVTTSEHGVTDLRFDSKTGSTVIGRLALDQNGKLHLSVLKSAEAVDSNYVAADVDLAQVRMP